MEYIVFSIVILAFLGIYFLSGIIANKKREVLFRQKLKNDFGKLPQKEYELEQFESISHYYKKHCDKGFFLDDITWNDLDMDRIFKLMNHTYSSAGEEYLYYTLRKLSQGKEELEELEKVISYFSQMEEERIEIQYLFSRLGKTGKFSLFDYLDYLKTLGKRSNTRHYLVNIAMFLTLCLIPFFSQGAIIALVVLIAFNISVYFKEKGEIEAYIISFSYILRLLRGATEMEKNKSKELEKYTTILGEKKKVLESFRKNSFWVMRSGGNITTMDPFEIVMDYIRMVFHVDLINFNKMLADIYQKEEVIAQLAETMGFLEMAISIAAFRKSIPTYCLPEFTKEKGIWANAIFHPLIEEPVTNTIQTKNSILLTGSNASGKSTFLKTVALNAVLAQTIHTVTATSYKGSFFRILSSMSLRDNIESGESYYMVEIRSIKRILDTIKEEGNTVLCFVDEVLRGTNTVERIAASTQILKSLESEKAICFAATHDIELTQLLEEEFTNYHFTEEVANGDVLFSYQLLKGKATSRNAIRLLELMGYDEEIIANAGKRAQLFMSEGNWS